MLAGLGRGYIFAGYMRILLSIPIDITELQFPSALTAAVTHRLVRSGISATSGLLDTCVFFVNIGIAWDWVK